MGNPDGRTVVAQVPVLSDHGRVVGDVAARVEAPSLLTGLIAATRAGRGAVGVAVVLGVAGSLLLARRVRRQTLGLEPAEIVELVQRREAMLLGVKEGVLGLDGTHRITLFNNAARELLGSTTSEPGSTSSALTTGCGRAHRRSGRRRPGGAARQPGARAQPDAGGRRQRAVGAVVTLPDHTELAALENRLDASRHLTDTLRAQTHEFTNRLHTIAGLTELGEHDEVRRFVAGIVAGSDQWRREVTGSVGTPRWPRC